MKKVILLVLAPLLLMILLIVSLAGLSIPVALGTILKLPSKSSIDRSSSRNPSAGSGQLLSGEVTSKLRNSDLGKTDPVHTFNKS